MVISEAVQVTPAREKEILSNPHIQMGFEVEFVYVTQGITSQAQAFSKCEQELTNLGLQFAPTQFQLTPDTSIDTKKQPSSFGIELVSPPLPLSMNLDNLQKVFMWMQDQGHETNFSTGLHINVSVQGLSAANLDKLKLLLLLDEHQVQQLFDRLMNSYTESHVEILKGAIAQASMKGQPWTNMRDFQKIKHVLNASIDLDKYRTVNFSKLQQGYLEFRIMGNQDYHKRWETVKSVVLRYAYVLLSALDQNAFVSEYNQAVARMFAQGLSQAVPVYPDLSHKYASVGAGAKPEDHMKVLDYIQRARKAVSDNNPKAAVKLITLAIQKADKFSYGPVNANLINAAALSYRILIQKILGMTVPEFVKAQAEAGVKPDVVHAVKTYLMKF
jgi:hypothetical protein